LVPALPQSVLVTWLATFWPAHCATHPRLLVRPQLGIFSFLVALLLMFAV